MPSASPGTARADPRSAHRVLMGEALTCCATPELLAALAPQPGERLLDVGCGAGAATFRAAVLAGRDGAVVGVDVSPAVLRLARERAARAGAGAVRFHAGDMQTARVAGGPFDAAMSQFGSMFFDDPVAAFANIRNHLRPGGRLGLSCWLRAGANPWSYAALIADLTREAAAPGSRPGPFSLASAPAVATLLGRAGFDAVAVTPRHGHVEVDPDAVVDDVELLLMGVPPDRIDEALARVTRHLSAFRTAPRILRLPIAYLVVTARNGNRAGTEPRGTPRGRATASGAGDANAQVGAVLVERRSNRVEWWKLPQRLG